MRPVIHAIFQNHHFYRVLTGASGKGEETGTEQVWYKLSSGNISFQIHAYIFFQHESEFVISLVFPNLYTSIGI